MFGSPESENQSIQYGDFRDRLTDQGLDVTPAEIHGALSGQLAAGASREQEAALSGLSRSRDMNIHGELAEEIMRLYGVIADAMEDETLDFHLLLPDDDVAIEERAGEMALWCRGFLTGFATGVTLWQQGGDTQVGGDAQEILKDFAAIAQAEAETDADDEELEESYAELYEYLRMAALNLHLHMQESPGAAMPAEAPPESTH